MNVWIEAIAAAFTVTLGMTCLIAALTRPIIKVCAVIADRAGRAQVEGSILRSVAPPAQLPALDERIAQQLDEWTNARQVYRALYYSTRTMVAVCTVIPVVILLSAGSPILGAVISVGVGLALYFEKFLKPLPHVRLYSEGVMGLQELLENHETDARDRDERFQLLRRRVNQGLLSQLTEIEVVLSGIEDLRVQNKQAGRSSAEVG